MKKIISSLLTSIILSACNSGGVPNLNKNSQSLQEHAITQSSNSVNMTNKSMGEMNSQGVYIKVINNSNREYNVTARGSSGAYEWYSGGLENDNKISPENSMTIWTKPHVLHTYTDSPEEKYCKGVSSKFAAQAFNIYATNNANINWTVKLTHYFDQKILDICKEWGRLQGTRYGSKLRLTDEKSGAYIDDPEDFSYTDSNNKKALITITINADDTIDFSKAIIRNLN